MCSYAGSLLIEKEDKVKGKKLKDFGKWKKNLSDEERRELDSTVREVSPAINDFVSESDGDRDYWFELKVVMGMRQLTSGEKIRSFTKETRFRGQPCISVVSHIPVNEMNAQDAASCVEEISDIMSSPNLLIAKHLSDERLIVTQHYTETGIINEIIGGFEEDVLDVVDEYM